MELKLYKNFPISDYSNQVFYKNENERDSAFDKYEDTNLNLTELSSCDKSKQIIRLNVNYFVGNKYNYGCIIEKNKRYYIFINSVEWKSNLNTVILHYSYDFWQTYCYRVNFKECLVEREHVENDTFGLHTIDENLPISDYIVKKNEVINTKNKQMLFCISLSDNRYIFSDIADTSNLKNAPLFFTNEKKTNLQPLTLGFENPNDASKCIDFLVNNDMIDSINGYYLTYINPIYKTQVWVGKKEDIKNGSYACICWQLLPASSYDNIEIERLKTFEDFKPLNNKCFLYPYNFINITNNQGGNIKALFENSNDKNKIIFSYIFPTQEGNAISGFLKNYNNVTYNLDYSINGMTNIELPFITNTYSAYISANINSINNSYATIERNYENSNNNLAFNTFQNGLSNIGKALTGNIANAVNGLTEQGINVIQSKMNIENSNTNALESINASLKDNANKGNIQHGAFNFNHMQVLNQIGFKIQTMQVRTECIKTIDDYFNMFGYKVNQIKEPKFDTRPYWNYIKTSGLNLVANIPLDAINSIKSMFNSGTTIWHKLEYMFEYKKYKKGNSLNG